MTTSALEALDSSGVVADPVHRVGKRDGACTGDFALPVGVLAGDPFKDA
jgi:hypothetical protein